VNSVAVVTDEVIASVNNTSVRDINDPVTAACMATPSDSAHMLAVIP
jgi:hypothetical protein